MPVNSRRRLSLARNQLPQGRSTKLLLTPKQRCTDRAHAPCDTARPHVLILDGRLSCCQLVGAWTPLQDACCASPSDWLDAGQSDSYVTAVPSGFVREVVVDKRCYNKTTRGAHVKKEPTVYYHYFEEVLVGPQRTRKVHRTALLRAAERRSGGKGEPTVSAKESVQNFLMLNPYVRSWGRKLQLKDFVFETGTRKAPPPAAAKPNAADATGTRKVDKAASKPAVAATTKTTSAPKAYLFRGKWVYKCGQCSACKHPERIKTKCQDEAGRNAAVEEARRKAERTERANKRRKVLATSAVAVAAGASGAAANIFSPRGQAALDSGCQDPDATDGSSEEQSEYDDASEKKVETQPTTKGGKGTATFHFPLTGGALKCSECARWHCVPEQVMKAVRFFFPGGLLL